MLNVNEIVEAELAKVEARASALRSALNALSLGDAATKAEAKLAAKPARARKSPDRDLADKAKRGPDSELTKARKRIASAKRWGKTPDEADVKLVAVYEPQAAAE